MKGALNIVVLVAAILFVAGCGQRTVQTENAATEQSKQELANLQSYALSVCLARSYPEQKIAADADAAAAGYLETGTLPIEAYERVRGLVDLAIKREYSSKHDADLSVMRCADFALGDEVKAAVTEGGAGVTEGS